MTDIVKVLMLKLMSEKCFDNYFIEFNFFHLECFKALLSKGLGIAIIAGSIFVKVPQILKIFASKSSEGISILSVCLDLFVITCHVSYSYVKGFPFSSWGDGSFSAAQTAVIAVLVLFYSGLKSKAAIFPIVYLSFCYLMMGGITPVEYLWTVQLFNVPILFMAKVIQSFANYKNQSTGQLSAVTSLMLFFGSLARIFTSVQETGDFMMILTFTVSTIGNAMIVFQLIYYWNSSANKPKHVSKTTKPKLKSKKVE